MSKEQRSLIHNTVKEVFGPALIGTTHDKNGKKFIKLARFVKGGECLFKLYYLFYSIFACLFFGCLHFKSLNLHIPFLQNNTIIESNLITMSL